MGTLSFQTSTGALCQALPFSPVTFVASFLSLIWSSLSPLLTHIAGNILDAVLTNTSITNDIQFITTLPCGLSSDHYLIHLTLLLDQPSTVPHKVHLSVYDYSKANWDEFLFFLQSQDYTDYLGINNVEHSKAISIIHVCSQDYHQSSSAPQMVYVYSSTSVKQIAYNRTKVCIKSYSFK